MTSVKIVFNQEIRRASINISKEDVLTFESLQQLVIKLYPILASINFQVCYRDDENDLVTFSSDEELNEAVKFMLPKSTTLKFTVQASSNQPSPSFSVPETHTQPSPEVELNKPLVSSSTTTTATLTTLTKTSNKTFVLPSVSFSSDNTTSILTAVNPSFSSIPVDGNANNHHESMGLTNFNSIEGNNDDEKVGFKRRRCYTVAEKFEIVKEYLCNRNNMTQFALERNIKPKTFSAWMKEYQDGKLDPTIVTTQDIKRFRLRKAEYPEIEKSLIDYITSFDPNHMITWSSIRNQALIIAKDLLNDEELQHFKASDGWIQNFLKRNNIILKKNYVVQIGSNPNSINNNVTTPTTLSSSSNNSIINPSSSSFASSLNNNNYNTGSAIIPNAIIPNILLSSGSASTSVPTTTTVATSLSANDGNTQTNNNTVNTVYHVSTMSTVTSITSNTNLDEDATVITSDDSEN